jgi:hypothetical protein
MSTGRHRFREISPEGIDGDENGHHDRKHGNLSKF